LSPRNCKDHHVQQHKNGQDRRDEQSQWDNTDHENQIQGDIMLKNETNSGAPDKKFAAVCGLYCQACTIFIATNEDPARLKELAARFQLPEEELKCGGCRSDMRTPYCQQCKMFACAAERGLDFCVECSEYPCAELKQFQSQAPHRIELWEDLERIGAVGHQQWLIEVNQKYTCPECRSINSAYDLKCRKCGQVPSCSYVAKHRQAIEPYL
jgi:hypothetical protein